MSIKRAEIETKLNNIFNNGDIFNATDEELDKYLKYFCTGHVENKMVHPREITRGQTINTIKLFRYITRIQRTNAIFTIIIILLSIITLVVGGYSIHKTIESSQQIEKIIKIEEQKLLSIEKYYNELLQKINSQKGKIKKSK